MKAALALAACAALAAACTPTEPAADIARSAPSSEGEVSEASRGLPLSPSDDNTTTTAAVTTTTEAPATTTTAPVPVATTVTVRRTTTTVYVEPPSPQSQTVGRGDEPAGGDIGERIAQCESGGSYTAQNPRSTASGKYQYLDSTWAGYGGYESAKDAPPWMQEERFANDLATVGTRPWNASRHCWGS